MIIPTLGITIYFVYSLVGRSNQLSSLEGYPRWYQDMVVKEAARQAGQDQRDIILSQQ